MSSPQGRGTEVASRAGRKNFPCSIRPGFLCIEVFVYINPSGDRIRRSIEQNIVQSSYYIIKVIENI